jgi:lipopolysaccharide/colanic/teichoic acid biosynthesis glycosyltransferase
MSRVIDVVAAVLGLLLLAPVLLIVSLLILAMDGHPILFSQIRIGRKGRPFRIWKFRTMRRNAEGRPITAAGDTRITRIGSVLRKFKIDELPQLFNVVRGDMSLIGPRPEVPEFVSLGAPIWQAVLQVRPGVTDLASLLFRDEEKLLESSSDPATFYRESVLPAKLVLNVGYLRYRTLRRDIRLLFLTALYSFFPERFNPDYIKRTVGAGVIR